jgi:hypothetical protein
MEERIDVEDLNVLQVLKSRSEAAIANAKAIDLEYRNQILRTFIKYNLSLDDGFDDLSGTITRKAVAQPTPAEPAPEVTPVVVESTPANG